MEHDFWLDAWRAGRTGFHLAHVNPHLEAHHQVLEGARVLVPLCGKSLDLGWLIAHGKRVVGVELSQQAVEALFAERHETPDVTREGALQCYRAGDLTVYCGDFFALDAAQLGRVDSFYDRAALVALPPAVRRRYVSHLTALVGADASGLLVAFDYPQAEMSGPPFSVGEAEVHDLFDPAFEITLRASHDILANEPRFRERGLSALHERVYALTRRA